jgi:hypothetical protein
MKFVSCTPESIPSNRPADTIFITQYANIGDKDVGYFGLALPNRIKRSGLAPSNQIWDFTTFALTVSAIDKLMPRTDSPDGWTRELDVEIQLSNPSEWNDLVDDLQNLLRFLTGDFWTLHFSPGGHPPPRPKTTISYDADCVCLLSGGIDSLIGGIDLTNNGRTPLFVSQIVNGSRNHQEEFANALGAGNRFFQWGYEAKLSGYRERSTRGRSLVFFAFAALASTALQETMPNPIDIIVPENGFISLNVALSPGRLGSLSTKTTHPIYMKGIQELWDNLGISLQLQFPYRNSTKGEMIEECKDQTTLQQLIGESISCGKYHINRHMHCGVCIPCLVRRAAFAKVGWSDPTVYRRDLSNYESDDISVAASAWLTVCNKGVRNLTAGALSFTYGDEKKQLEDVVTRGITEIYTLLHSFGRI